MNNILKNSWLTAGMILVIHITIGIILSTIFSLFGLSGGTLSSVMSLIIASVLVGVFYAHNLKKVMPKHQRLNSAIICSSIAFIILILAFIILIRDKVFFIIALVLGVFVAAISIAIIYYSLRKGGELYLNKNGKTS